MGSNVKSNHLSRRGWLGGLAATSLVGPRVVSNAAAAGQTKLVYQTAWSPEPADGGLYQAVATGIYRSYGLDVELHAGGPQLNVNQIFLAGQADFVGADSFGLFQFVHQNLPGIAIAAFAQKAPYVILSHPHVGNDTLLELKDKPILIAASDRETYWVWLKAKYGFSDDQVRPYTFNMAPFLLDKTMNVQGFVYIEPYLAQRAGVEPVVHLLADNGYLDYNGVVIAAPRLVREQKPIVQRFVDATIKGWQSYLYGDPKPANDVIKNANPEMTDGMIAYARNTMKRRGIYTSADVTKGGLGAMTDARWQSIYRSMADVGALPAGLNVRAGYTLEFVNKRVGVA
jgi:NitT/TauT family transport system substrate-binding protein